jgi:hypothetical protein
MSDKAPPRRETLLDLIETFREAEAPLLIHCKAGADRAGLASAIYLLTMTDAPLADARRMLSWRFLHLVGSKAGVLDAVLDAYAATSGHALRRLGRRLSMTRALRCRDNALTAQPRGIRYNTACWGQCRRPVMSPVMSQQILSPSRNSSDACRATGAAEDPRRRHRCGNEPFWRVDIAADDFTLTRPDFEPLMLSVIERRTEADGTHLIVSASSSPALRAFLSLAPGPCATTRWPTRPIRLPRRWNWATRCCRAAAATRATC